MVEYLSVPIVASLLATFRRTGRQVGGWMDFQVSAVVDFLIFSSIRQVFVTVYVLP